MRTRVDLFNRIGQDVDFLLQLQHIPAERIHDKLHYHLYCFLVIVELLAPDIGEYLIDLGAEFVNLGPVLGS